MGKRKQYLNVGVIDASESAFSMIAASLRLDIPKVLHPHGGYNLLYLYYLRAGTVIQLVRL